MNVQGYQLKFAKEMMPYVQIRMNSSITLGGNDSRSSNMTMIGLFITVSNSGTFAEASG